MELGYGTASSFIFAFREEMGVNLMALLTSTSCTQRTGLRALGGSNSGGLNVCCRAHHRCSQLAHRLRIDLV